MIHVPVVCCKCGHTLKNPHFLDQCLHCRHPVKESLFRSMLEIDTQGHLCEEVLCVRCDYNLKSILYDGLCPECGHEVEPSTIGHKLLWHEHKWLQTIQNGYSNLTFALYLSLINLNPLLPQSWGLLIVSGLYCLGIWRLTRSNDAVDSHAKQLRHMRILRGLGLGLAALSLAVFLAGQFTANAGWNPTLWISLILLSSILVYPTLFLLLARTQSLILILKPDQPTGVFLLLKLFLSFIVSCTVIECVCRLVNFNLPSNQPVLFFLFIIISILTYILLIVIALLGQHHFSKRIKLCQSLA